MSEPYERPAGALRDTILAGAGIRPAPLPACPITGYAVADTAAHAQWHLGEQADPSSAVLDFLDGVDPEALKALAFSESVLADDPATMFLEALKRLARGES